MNPKIVRGISLFALIAICISIFSLPAMAAEISVDFPMYGTIDCSKEVNVRKKNSSSSAKLGTLPDGTVVELLSKNGNWYCFLYNGEEAFIYAKYVKLGCKGIVTAKKANIRSGSSTKYDIIGSQRRGDTVNIYRKEGNWYRVFYDGHDVAYMYDTLVKIDEGCNIEESAPKTQTGYVSAAKLNVRSGPGTEYENIGVLYFGTTIDIVSKEKNWYKIRYQDDFAYVHVSHVETDPNALCGMAMVSGDDIVKVYSSRSTKSDVRTRVIKGAILKAEKSTSTWAKVEANGLSGYIKLKHIDLLTFQEYHDLSRGETKSKTVIASYSTSFKGKDKKAIINIKSAASFINEVIVYPGETFDYYGLTHPKGFLYEIAPIIVNGEHSKSRGGGLCQLSSTLHAAIKSAEKAGVDTGLNVTARFPHSKAVGYVPVAYEATIASYYTTFAFTNINTYPVKIITKISGNTLTIKIVKV